MVVDVSHYSFISNLPQSSPILRLTQSCRFLISVESQAPGSAKRPDTLHPYFHSQQPIKQYEPFPDSSVKEDDVLKENPAGS